jgi:TonB family protein
MLPRLFSRPPSPRIWFWIIAITLVIIVIFIWTEIARADMPAPSCPPDREATVVRAVAPDTRVVSPIIMFMSTPSIETDVLVSIDTDGKVKSATVQKASGYRQFDQETLRAARLSEYAPAITNCRAEPGTYLFRATFPPPDQARTPSPE